ncbi:uncharacterized protein LOC119307157 [Triticum dicoccoides]|uniref:uncharacterized protein LOC119307157 n=1 Tax=Triticum dicoccoides TaxID=85692 RepID=UPI001890869D|nr:uncharacterized protein LOC119307157 [Triticum dicoccoides]XP_044392586.1 uncharacterized protein LOC123115503 [Triticum aestivum]
MDGPRRLLALAVLLASAFGADAAGLFRAPPTGYKYNATFTFTGQFLVLLSCMGPANDTAAYGHGGIIHSCTLDQLKEGSSAPETTPLKFNHGHGHPAPSPRAAPPEDGLLQAAAGGEQEQHAGAAPAMALPLGRRRRRLRHCLQRWLFANGRTMLPRSLDAVNHGHRQGHPPPSPSGHAAAPENGLLQAAAGGGGPREHAVPQPQQRLPPHPHGGGGGEEEHQHAVAAPAVAPRRRRLRHCLQRWSCANGRTTPARSLDVVSDGGKKKGEEDENLTEF